MKNSYFFFINFSFFGKKKKRFVDQELLEALSGILGQRTEP